MPTDLPFLTGGTPDFEIVDHTADWALRVYGQDLTHLFQNAAHGLSTLLVEDLGSLSFSVERQLILDSIDVETLLVDWLGELAYWAESELLVFSKFVLSQVSETHLKATLLGGHVPSLSKHIKAVTYHELEIVAFETGLTATIVFDV